MADVRLQDYVTKVRDLVQAGHPDEAIAHCQHILRHHSRHVETYCLLGEACLEKGMYGEAIEFFQRTLSADPENFVARVGLGIIYGEQGALPGAIWQMERAFELAPGSTEVRRELLSLYGQREGTEKTRLKLTQGALGRLYSRNGLYERAIGEFRAVLRQDPDLPDIQIALAEALWRDGRRLEAVNTCLELVQALPQCLKANLILGEVWTQGGDEEAGEERLQVAQALDPENRVAQEMLGQDSPLPLKEVWLPMLDVVPGSIAAVLPGEEPAAEAEGAEPELAEWEGEGEESGQGAGGMDERAVPAEGVVPEEEARAVELEEEAPSEEEVSLEEEDAIEEEALFEEESPLEAEAPLEEAMAPEGVALPGDEISERLPDLEAPAGVVDEGTVAPPEEDVPESLRALVEAGILEESDLVAAMAEMPEEDLEAQRAEEVPRWVRNLIGEGALVDEVTGAAGEAEELLVGEEEDAVPPAEEPPSVAEAVFEEEVLPPEEDEGEVEAAAEELPKWLRDLWVPAAAAATLAEAEPALAWEEEEVPAAETTPASAAGEEWEEEAPDWLRELEAAGQAEPEWAAEADVASAAEAEVASAAEAQIASAGEVESEELPAWLQELWESAVERMPAAPAEVGLASAWEEEEMPAAEMTPAVAAETTPAVAAETTPAVAAETTPAAGEGVEGLPEGLKELEVPLEAEPLVAAATEVAPEPEAVEVADEEPTSAAEAQIASAAEAEMVSAAEMVSVSAGEEVPASLRALVLAGFLDESELAVVMAHMSAEDLEAHRGERIPDWLRDLTGEEPPAVKMAPVPALEEEVIEAPQEEVQPDLLGEVAPEWVSEEWMEEIPSLQEDYWPGDVTEEVEEGAIEAPAAAIPDWLEEGAVEASAAAIPDWLEEGAIEAPAAVVPEAGLGAPAPEETILEPSAAKVAGEAPVEAEEVALGEEAEEKALEGAPVEAEEVTLGEAAEEKVLGEVPVEAEEVALGEEAEEKVLEGAPVEAEEVTLGEAVEEKVLEEVPVLEEGLLEPAGAGAVEEDWPPVAEEEGAEPLAADLSPLAPEPEAAHPTAREMVAPYDRVEIEEVVPVRRRIDDLAERLKANPRDYPLRLELARLHREEQEWAAALTDYQDLIAARKFLPNILDDLELMLKRGVEKARVYQLMGDAYLQENALDKALQMYRLAQQALTKR